MGEHDDMPYIVVERRSGGGLGAFVLGALLGAGVALLLAPRSGRELREEIGSGARRLRETAEDTVRNVQQSVDNAITGVREQVVGRVEAARDAFDAGREAARESRADMERRIQRSARGLRSGRSRRQRGRPIATAEADPRRTRTSSSEPSAATPESPPPEPGATADPARAEPQARVGPPDARFASVLPTMKRPRSRPGFCPPRLQEGRPGPDLLHGRRHRLQRAGRDRAAPAGHARYRRPDPAEASAQSGNKAARIHPQCDSARSARSLSAA